MFLTENDTKQAEGADASLDSSDACIKPNEYFRQVKAHLRAGNQIAAFALLQQLVMHSPDEPVLLSYYGYLLVRVARRYRMGIETCLLAIEKLQTRTFDEESVYPVFYCNLGMAYAIAGKRKEALEALNRGHSYDRWNSDIMKAKQSLGIRRKSPPIPFLNRSNPLNIVIGIMLQKDAAVVRKKP